MFFHLPKSGGSALATWLRQNGQKRGMRVPSNVSILRSPDYNCGCRFIETALANHSIFSDTDIISTHMAAYLLDYMTAEDLARTVVIVSSRDPVQRTVSGYNYLRLHWNRTDMRSETMTLDQWLAPAIGNLSGRFGNETRYLVRSHPMSNALGFQMGAYMNRGRCCRHLPLPQGKRLPGDITPKELMAAAEKRLRQQVCGVFVAERSEESAQALAWLLGWDVGQPLSPLVRRNPTPDRDDAETVRRSTRRRTQWEVPEEVARKITSVNQVDVPLHTVFLARLDEELEAMVAATPPWMPWQAEGNSRSAAKRSVNVARPRNLPAMPPVLPPRAVVASSNVGSAIAVGKRSKPLAAT